MSRVIVLDSTPLALLAISPAEPLALQCERWLRAHIAGGAQIIVPEIVAYELRRELIRLGRIRSLLRLDTLLIDPGVTYLPITTRAMRLAANLWAEARGFGRPTAQNKAATCTECVLNARLT